MSKKGKPKEGEDLGYYMIPVGMLAYPKQGEDRKAAMRVIGVMRAGHATIQKLSDADLAELADRHQLCASRDNNLLWLKFGCEIVGDDLTDEVDGIKVPLSVDAIYSEASAFLDEWHGKYAADPKNAPFGRVKNDVMRDVLKKGKDGRLSKDAITMRELAGIIAVRSILGKKTKPWHIPAVAIQYRMAGFCAAEFYRKGVGAGDVRDLLTPRQVDTTIDKLTERRFFSRYTPISQNGIRAGRTTYYGLMTKKELVKAVMSGDLYKKRKSKKNDDRALEMEVARELGLDLKNVNYKNGVNYKSGVDYKNDVESDVESRVKSDVESHVNYKIVPSKILPPKTNPSKDPSPKDALQREGGEGGIKIKEGREESKYRDPGVKAWKTFLEEKHRELLSDSLPFWRDRPDLHREFYGWLDWSPLKREVDREAAAAADQAHRKTAFTDDGLPNCETARRIHRLYNRGDLKVWSKEEQEAFHANVPTDRQVLETLSVIEKFYASEPVFRWKHLDKFLNDFGRVGKNAKAWRMGDRSLAAKPYVRTYEETEL